MGLVERIFPDARHAHVMAHTQGHLLYSLSGKVTHSQGQFPQQNMQRERRCPWLQLVEELFGVTIERTENSHTWHPDVQFYSLKKEGKQKAYFYLDPYSRPAGQQRGCSAAFPLYCPCQILDHVAISLNRYCWNYPRTL